MCGACGHPSAGAAVDARPVDAYTPYVTVIGGIHQGTWPNSMPIAFFNETGAQIAASPTDGGVRALLPDGGSIVFTEDNSSSPTSTYLIQFAVRGVRPGDYFNFDEPAPPLPDDCTATSVSFAVTGSTAAWNDPDAEHAVARIWAFQSPPFSGLPPYHGGAGTVLDGERSSSVPDSDNGLQSVVVMHCSRSTYDDVRTIMAVAAW
jgi:hypothetical protein